MHWGVAAAIALLTIGTAVRLALAWGNVRHTQVAVAAHAGWIRDALGVDEPAAIASYLTARTRAGAVSTLLTTAAVIAVLATGTLGAAVRWLDATAGSAPLAVVGLAVAAVVASQLLDAPVGYHVTFGIEERFGFNRQDRRGWLTDQLLSLAVGGVLTAAVVGALAALIVALPTWWPVAVVAATAALSVGMLVVYPRVIAPLFNEFRPVEDDAVAGAVEEVLEAAGVTCEQVYIMDASRRSAHANAYFVGFGETKRVVLFDTLLQQLSLSQVQAVLAHELAHWQRGHIWRRLAAGVGVTAATVAVVWALTQQPWLYAAFAIPTEAVYGAAVALLYVGPLQLAAAPLQNHLSRQHEWEADAEAVRLSGGAEPLWGALQTLSAENLANPFPHPWYAAVMMGHPPIAERLRRLRERGDQATSNEAATSA
jgi:Zn-dependent protease with chaperone function